MKWIQLGVKSKKLKTSNQNSPRPVFSSNNIIESFPSYLNGTIEDRNDYLRYILNSGFKKLIDTRTDLFKEYNREFIYSDLYAKINHQINLIDRSEELLQRNKLALDNLESLLLAKKEYEDLIIENDSKITDLIDSYISGTGLESQREKLIDDFSTRSFIYSNILREINIALSVYIGPKELQAQIAHTMKNTSPKRLRGWYILEKKENLNDFKNKITPPENQDQANNKEGIKQTGEVKTELAIEEDVSKIEQIIHCNENQKIEDEVSIQDEKTKSLGNSKLTPIVEAKKMIEYFSIHSNKDNPNRFFEVEQDVECLVYKLFNYGVTDYDHLDYYKDLGLNIICYKKQFAIMLHSLSRTFFLNPESSDLKLFTLLQKHFPTIKLSNLKEDRISISTYKDVFEKKGYRDVTIWGKKKNPDTTIDDLNRKYKNVI